MSKTKSQVAANSDIMPPSTFWAKTVPNSELEFTLYAKNLAWILQGKLTDARELLARMYGHKDSAAVQESLKAGTPGPFLDAPPYSADFGTNSYFEWRKQTERRTHDELRQHLYTRVRVHKPGEYDDELRYSLVNEIGLFCTPKAHQNLFKRVKVLIASESRISTFGFPVGYLLSLTYHFGADYKENAAAYAIFKRKAAKHLKQFTSEDCPFSHREILEFALERKAAGLLRLTMANINEEESAGENDVPEDLIRLAESHIEWGGWERTLDLDFADDVITEFLLGDEDEVQDEEEAENERNRNLALFLLNPCKDAARKCGVLKDYPDIVDVLPRWRFAVLYALAAGIESAYAEDGEDSFEVVETHARLSGDFRDFSSPWLRLTGIVRKNPGWEDLNRWNFSMQVSLQDKDTEVMEPVGRISGIFVNVLEDGGYKDDDDLESALRLDDDVLLQAWMMVKKHYRDRLGFSGMHEWVNRCMSHSFALVGVYVSPKFIGVIDERHMLDLLDDSFGEGAEFPELSAVEMVLGEPDFDADWYVELENRKAPFCQLGAVVLHVPGTGDLALSIFETTVVDSELTDNKCTKFLRRQGEVLTSSYGFWTGLRKWDGKALNDTDRLMEVVAKSTANVIAFDPLPWERKDRDDDN